MCSLAERRSAKNLFFIQLLILTDICTTEHVRSSQGQRGALLYRPEAQSGDYLCKHTHTAWMNTDEVLQNDFILMRFICSCIILL